MENADPKDPLIGQTLVDTYVVEEQLGAGGMGTLYKARHLKLGGYVALKFVRHQLRADVKTLKRLQREAQVLSGLHHPNIVSVRAFHVENNSDVFLVLELLKGRNLEQYVKENGPLSLAKFATIFEQVCAALTYAHSQGIIHRDLKPANILLIDRPDGQMQVKLLDFGLAKITDDTDHQKLTATGTLVGSINYISPEQCAGGKLDQRADVYSLACVMWDSLTGHVPFDDVSGMMVIRKHMEEHLPPLPEPLPKALSNVLQRCTAIDPNDRLSSVEQMWNAIESKTPVVVAAVKKPKRKLLTWRAPAVVVGVAVTVCFFVWPFAITSIKVWQTDSTTNKFIATILSAARSGDTKLLDRLEDTLEATPDVSIKQLEELGDLCAKQLPSAKSEWDRYTFTKTLIKARRRQSHLLQESGDSNKALDTMELLLKELIRLSDAGEAQNVVSWELEQNHFTEKQYFVNGILLLDVELLRPQYNEVIVLDRLDAAWSTSRRLFDLNSEGAKTDIPGAVRSSRTPPPALVDMAYRSARDLATEYLHMSKFTKARETIDQWLDEMNKWHCGSPEQIAAMKQLRDKAERASSN